MLSKTKNAVVYARYSSEKQSAGSIDDQVRNCIQFAELYGYEVKPEHIFSDSAVTGQKSGLTKRVEFQEMLKLIECGEVDCVILDELSRAGRDKLALLTFITTLEDLGVRLLVKSSGLDSTQEGFDWSSLLSIGLASHELALIRQRTTRGLLGALHQGGMTGYPPFGYKLGERVWAVDRFVRLFEIDEEKKQYVVDIFEMRAAGFSFYQIAQHFNELMLPTPRKPREDSILGGYWRANTVKQIVKNTLYRGVFTYHGSRQKQKKALASGKPLGLKEYSRTYLRIISDELWYSVQPTVKGNRRKGFTNRYTHRVSCHLCGNTCTVKKSATTTTLGCSVCLQAQRTDGLRNYRRAYEVSIRALDAVLQDVFGRLTIEGVLETYEGQLLKLVNSERNTEVETLATKLKDLDSRISVISKMISVGDGNASELEESYERMTQERTRLSHRFKLLSSVVQEVSAPAVKRHIDSLEPNWFMNEIFSGELEPKQCNEIIRRIFDSISYSKQDRNNSLWSVTVNLHELRLSTKSSKALEGKVKFEYQVFCKRATPTSYLATYRSHSFIDDSSV